ncbi:hypothetical protein BJX96DRAFT_147844 [Aspergillus floccosus]
MASIVNRPLNRFRKTDHQRPFHERWGDLAISAPTDGSWNQLDASDGAVSCRRHSRHGSIPETNSSRGSYASDDYDDDEALCLTDNSPVHSRQNSFSVRTLDPRRLSMRLTPRPKTPADVTNDKKERLSSQRERRTDFAYKPIRQDYPSEVAEKMARQNPHSSSGFRYIPANPEYSGQSEAAVSCHRYTSTGRASPVNGVVGLPERGARQRPHYRELVPDGMRSRSLPRDDTHARSVASCRLEHHGELDSGQRAGSVGVRNASSSKGRKAARSSRYLTMTMVPDPEDIYG